MTTGTCGVPGGMAAAGTTRGTVLATTAFMMLASGRRAVQVLPDRLADHAARVVINQLATQEGGLHPCRHVQAFKRRVTLR